MNMTISWENRHAVGIWKYFKMLASEVAEDRRSSLLATISDLHARVAIEIPVGMSEKYEYEIHLTFELLTLRDVFMKTKQLTE